MFFAIQLSHTTAQAEWNKIKTDEKLVQEKIAHYLEQYKSSSPLSADTNADEQPKKTRARKKKDEKNVEREHTGRVTKRGRKRAHSSDIENEMLNDNDANDEVDDDDDEAAGNKKEPTKIRTASEILAKKTKAPAQDKAAKELHEINERIIQLVQVKNMGMATVEQEKQLKKLLVEQKKKSNDLKRLKAEQAAKKRYREAKKVGSTSGCAEATDCLLLL